jgi:beta-lactamase class A
VLSIKTAKKAPRPLSPESGISISTSSSIPSIPTPRPTPTPLSRSQASVSNLKNDLISYLASRPAEWSVALSQDNTKLLSLNDAQPLGAASVMKLVTALAVAQEIEEETNLTTNTLVQENSLGTWAELLINQSNNEAWDVLRSYLGFRPEKKLVDTLGLKNTDIYQNLISASDVNKLLQFFWSNSQEMSLPILSWMYQTETESRIPQAVEEFFQDLYQYPPPIYHKAGSWPPTGTYNDVAIIPLADQVLFFSIISQGSQTQTQGEETIREITKIVFKHLTSVAFAEKLEESKGVSL